MPKPIKKKVYKKTSTQDEVRNIYALFSEYYKENRRFINALVIIIAVIATLIFGSIYYLKSSAEKSLHLQYEALRAFHGQLPDKSPEDALRVAYEKFKRSYEKKDNPYSLLYRAYTEARLGKNSEAIETINSLLKKYDTPDIQSLAYYKMYEIYLTEGKKDKALQALDALISLKGHYLKDLALYTKGMLLEQQNKKDKAIEVYKKLASEYPSSPYTEKIKDKIQKDKTAEEKNQSDNTTGKGAGK